jgi:GT2 family glycosyltransferase
MSDLEQARVTIIVTPRERFSFARESLDSLYANTAWPFRLLYVDAGSPAAVRRDLAGQARQRGFRLLRYAHYLPQNVGRNRALREAHTPYVVFLDNDVLLAPGWLPAMVRCAEETGAWVVAPVYCSGLPAHETIHVAGTEAGFRERDGRREAHETHLFAGARLAEVRPQLRRRPCDAAEFHCMLVRREVFERLGPLDEQILGTRDHIDLSFSVRAAGGLIYFEPDAIITYVAPPPFTWSDVPLYLLRWSNQWNDASLRRLSEKWRLEQDHERLLDSWLRPHRQVALGPLRERLQRLVGWRLGNALVDALENALVRRALRRCRTVLG